MKPTNLQRQWLDLSARRTWGRAGRAALALPFARRALILHDRGDLLAQRWWALRTHGWQTLHNFILGDHGRPNRY